MTFVPRCSVAPPHHPPLIRRAALLTGALLSALLPLNAPAIAPVPLDDFTAHDSPAWAYTLATWEEQMVTAGHKVGRHLLQERDENLLLAAQYYDGARVFRQIAAYREEKEPWIAYADAASAVYQRYLQRHDFAAAGWMRFPHGFYLEWLSGDRPGARDDLLALRDRAAFSDPDTNPWSAGWYEQSTSREIAFALENQVLAERMGATPQPERTRLYVDMALAHIDEWTLGAYRDPDPQQQFCQPFMAGLTATALIAWYEHARTDGRIDARIPPALARLADWLWTNTWVDQAEGTHFGAFRYVVPTIDGVGSDSPAADLNLLIAPLYGWLWHHTGDVRYRQRGDEIFAGGVALADLESGKRFNQNYRDSFAYVTWRELPPRTASPVDAR